MKGLFVHRGSSYGDKLCVVVSVGDGGGGMIT
jgi:hypothetical protein